MLDQSIFKKEIEEQFTETIKLRRSFHQYPEPGMEEFQTTEMIAKELSKLEIPYERLEPTGLFAYLGPKSGYTIALRADIDGLKITEETDCTFRSLREGYMHACGHDGHMAGLLAASRVLKKHEAELDVRVKLIFEPSEENTLGAKRVIAQGVLDDVDEIFGLHLFSDIETGTVSVEAGPRMAQTDRFSICFEGRGGHAGKPHQCIDATVMAADFVMSTQTIVSREIDPVDSAVVTIGHLTSGTQYNIISQTAQIEGTCRSFSEKTALHLKDAIEKRAKNIADYYGGSAKIGYDFGAHPPVCNDEGMSLRIEKKAKEILGEGFIKKVPKLMLGEDFSWYQTILPGVFAFVGCGNESEGIIYPNHHPKFAIDEEALKHAALLHLCAVSSAEEKFRSKK